MNRAASLLQQLSALRNQYGAGRSSEKLRLLAALEREKFTSRKSLQQYYDNLLFLLAYPDNKEVYDSAMRLLDNLQEQVETRHSIRDKLFNSGITGTQLCSAFSFDIVKWFRRRRPTDIEFHSFDADDSQIQAILSVIMPRVESEALLDTSSAWRTWLSGNSKKPELLLDNLIAAFDEATIRPFVRDELWNAIGVNVVIRFSIHLCLPPTLIKPYFHRSLFKKPVGRVNAKVPAIQKKLTSAEAETIIECGRMILVRHLREIDPITFTAARLVAYYQLPRGLSIALVGMVPERRSPIDSYMGYVVFKNGWPVAYAGSWIFFDSARIGLNVFPAYRGGESQYIFDQVLRLHSKVYRLNRFSVDPYQIGKENKDAIQSGAFWVYYKAGFRPLEQTQKQLARKEAEKIRSARNYRSPAAALKILADSRLELYLENSAFGFDATDLSRVYAEITRRQYNGDRKRAADDCLPKLAALLPRHSLVDETLKFVLENWAVLLFGDDPGWRPGREIKKTLIRIFELKSAGPEEEYIREMQRSTALRKIFKALINKYQ